MTFCGPRLESFVCEFERCVALCCPLAITSATLLTSISNIMLVIIVISSAYFSTLNCQLNFLTNQEGSIFFRHIYYGCQTSRKEKSLTYTYVSAYVVFCRKNICWYFTCIRIFANVHEKPHVNFERLLRLKGEGWITGMCFHVCAHTHTNKYILLCRCFSMSLLHTYSSALATFSCHFAFKNNTCACPLAQEKLLCCDIIGLIANFFFIIFFIISFLVLFFCLLPLVHR